MSETYRPEPINPSDFDPDNLVEGEAHETPRRAGLRARLARKVMGVISAEQEQRGLNATIDRMTAPERNLDNLITDDQEILGQSGSLRRELRDGTKGAMNTVDKHLARLRNTNPLSKTRDAYLAYRRDRIAGKVDRLERLVAENPTSRLGKRRQKELEMFRKRHKWREGQIEKRGKKAINRGEKVTNRITKRNEKFQEQVDKYIADKVEAMRRKEQRKLMKREGISRLNPAERARFIANLPAETKKRLTREAILAVREKNIKQGKLDWLYDVDETKDVRKVGSYGRTVE